MSDDAISTKPDKCLDNIRKQKKLCVDYSDGNKFCYKFKEDVDNVDHSKPSASKYGFNGQKRGVPEHASDIMTLYNVTQNCGYYCSEKLGGLLTSQTPESSILVSALLQEIFPAIDTLVGSQHIGHADSEMSRG